MVQLGNLKVLVIEARQGMRKQMQGMLGSFHIAAVNCTTNAGAALRALQRDRFDLILCSHDLGEGQDGQHLLEDLRTYNMIPRATTFVMISSERNFERVIGTAELAPDDYILTPLSPGTLFERLQRIMKRREIFLPTWKLIDASQINQAIASCIAQETTHPRYRHDFMRLRAELLESLGDIDEACAVYSHIAAEKAVPWAQLGIARQLHRRQDFAGAQVILQSLVAQHDHFIAARDWLARSFEATGDTAQAYEVLRATLTLSPNRLNRLRDLSRVAEGVGDHDAAENLLSELVRRGKYSDFRDPEDHVRLLQRQVRRRKFKAAWTTLRDLEQSMGLQASTRACATFSQAILLQATNHLDEARSMLEAAIAEHGSLPLSTELKLDFLALCLEQQLDDPCQSLVDEMLRHPENEHSQNKLFALLHRHGRGELSAKLHSVIQAEVTQLIRSSEHEVRDGDFVSAVSHMLRATRLMPGDPDLLIRTAQVLLQHIDRNGWNDHFFAQADKYIDRCRRVHPDHPDLAVLLASRQQLLIKYGISGKAPATQANHPRNPS